MFSLRNGAGVGSEWAWRRGGEKVSDMLEWCGLTAAAAETSDTGTSSYTLLCTWLIFLQMCPMKETIPSSVPPFDWVLAPVCKSYLGVCDSLSPCLVDCHTHAHTLWPFLYYLHVFLSSGHTDSPMSGYNQVSQIIPLYVIEMVPSNFCPILPVDKNPWAPYWNGQVLLCS